MTEPNQREVMRAALAVLTYPRNGDVAGLHALIGEWELDDFLVYVSTTQVILAALAEEFGHDRVDAVVDQLRRVSYQHE